MCLEDLPPLIVLHGPNSSGKSSILRATQAQDDFAQYFAKDHTPAETFRGENPDQAQIQEVMRRLPNALVFGHDGGGSLRAFSSGDPGALFVEDAMKSLRVQRQPGA